MHINVPEKEQGLFQRFVKRVNMPRWPVQALCPRFVNNDHVIADVTCSTASMRFTRHSLGQGLLCAVHLCKLHLEKPGRVVCGYVVLYCAVPTRRE